MTKDFSKKRKLCLELITQIIVDNVSTLPSTKRIIKKLLREMKVNTSTYGLSLPREEFITLLKKCNEIVTYTGDVIIKQNMFTENRIDTSAFLQSLWHNDIDELVSGAVTNRTITEFINTQSTGEFSLVVNSIKYATIMRETMEYYLRYLHEDFSKK